MDWLTIAVTLDASCLKSEGLNQEVMSRLKVLVNQEWDDAREGGHWNLLVVAPV